MKVYRSKYGMLPGTSYNEIMAAARREYHTIQKRTPRRIPYIRSAYFAKDKIFLNTFWDHLKQKHPADHMRRLKFYLCAIDLIRNSRETPDTIFSKDDLNVLLHRFSGVTKDGQYFSVQLKENKRTDRKDFLSVFPSKRP
jgi:hypothetical protein